MRFENIDELSKLQKIYLYNAGVIMNGRVYSVEVNPEYELFIPLDKILENIG